MGNQKSAPLDLFSDPSAPTLLSILHVRPDQRTKRVQALLFHLTRCFSILELGEGTWDLSTMALRDMAERIHTGMNSPGRFHFCVDRDVYLAARRHVAIATGLNEQSLSLFSPLATQVPTARHGHVWKALQQQFPVLKSISADIPGVPYAFGAAISVIAILAVMVPLARAMDRQFPGRPPWPVALLAAIAVPLVFFGLLCACLLSLIRFSRLSLPARLPARCPTLGTIAAQIRRRIPAAGTDASGPGQWTIGEIEHELVALIAHQAKRPMEAIDSTLPLQDLRK